MRKVSKEDDNCKTGLSNNFNEVNYLIKSLYNVLR